MAELFVPPIGKKNKSVCSGEEIYHGNTGVLPR